METTLRTILFVLLFAFIIQIQINLDADKTATRQLKNALEIAVHDTALALDPESLSVGFLVFQDGSTLPDGRVLKDTAIQNMKKSIEENLNLTSSGGFVYTPTEDSFFQHEVYLWLEFVDHRSPIFLTTPDVNGGYLYVNDQFDIIEKIYGPSVVAVLTTESPRWFKGDSPYIRQAAVYEYIK